MLYLIRIQKHNSDLRETLRIMLLMNKNTRIYKTMVSHQHHKKLQLKIKTTPTFVHYCT